jgi:uncharacterized damage-inducible protein DinB
MASSLKSDFDALRDDLRQVYDGEPWHGSPIAAVLKGVDAETAARRSIPRGHTIWELVLHMTVWTREVASRVRGNDAADPPEDWPRQPAKFTEKDWRAAMDSLRDAHTEMVRAVDDLKPDDLVRIVSDHRPSAEIRRSVGSHIRGLIQHDTYHLGQISLLLRTGD